MSYLVKNYCNNIKITKLFPIKVISNNSSIPLNLIYWLCVIAPKFVQQSIFKNKKEQKRFCVWCRRWEGNELRLVCTVLTSSRTSTSYQWWRTGHLCWDVSVSITLKQLTMLKDLQNLFRFFVNCTLFAINIPLQKW